MKQQTSRIYQFPKSDRRRREKLARHRQQSNETPRGDARSETPDCSQQGAGPWFPPAAGIFLCALLALAGTSLLAGPARKINIDAPAQSVLILYDSAGQFGWTGQAYGRQLANLIGHFQLQYELKAIEDYRGGDLSRYRATFYLGSVYDNAVPQTFIDDVMGSSTPVMWFKYNLWKLAGPTWASESTHPYFEYRFGFHFHSLDQKSGYNYVRYRGETFSKSPQDSEVGITTVVNQAISRTVMEACSTPEGAPDSCKPYVVQGSNLWYVADIPFSYVTEEDRYVAFADVLHDFLNFPHQESHRALLRIEDVNPYSNPAVLREIADYLAGERVPFVVAVTPVFTDAFGYFTGGTPVFRTMSDSPAFVEALHYMVRRGGSIVLNGYTHQYAQERNPFTGVTGDDFEFFRVGVNKLGQIVTNQPVPEDSEVWVNSRINAARNEMDKAGLRAVGWKTPHYGASALDYRAFAKAFEVTTQRILYLDYALTPRGPEHKSSIDPAFFAPQFFPYLIHRDIYGQKIVPENLGTVDPYGYAGRLPRLADELVVAARKNLVVRDGWASAAFYSYLDLGQLQTLVKGIKAQGYTFVPLTVDIR